ncbi:MAG: hypothetical protein R3B09_15325 [Nannocystaceae bacterium]
MLPQPEGEIVLMVAPLPEGFEAVTSFQHVGAELRTPAIDAVRQHHASRVFAARPGR